MSSERGSDGDGVQGEQARERAVRWLNYSVPLFRAFGIPIRLHWSFFFVVLLFAGWTAAGGDSIAVQFGWALVHATALYALVLLHELCHAGAAAMKGRSTGSIVLTPLGGMAVIDGAMGGPAMEAEVAFAGPAVNLLLLAISEAVVLGIGAGELTLGPGPLAAVAFLFWANLSLALFNLIPAFPMDGGRVLRAFLSWRYGEKRGTRAAARAGEAISASMIVAGIWASTPGGWLLAGIGTMNILSCEMAIRYLEMGYGVYEETAIGTVAPGPTPRERSAAEAAELERRVDGILDKVSKHGLGALTRRERAVLKGASTAYKKSSRL